MSKKNKDLMIQSLKELETCCHCSRALKQSDIDKYPKQPLSGRYGVYWTGIEQAYLQIFKIKCPNLSCSKKYKCKLKISHYKYA